MTSATRHKRQARARGVRRMAASWRGAAVAAIAGSDSGIGMGLVVVDSSRRRTAINAAASGRGNPSRSGAIANTRFAAAI